MYVQSLRPFPRQKKGRTAPKIERRSKTPSLSILFENLRLASWATADRREAAGGLVNRIEASSENVKICVVHEEKKKKESELGKIFGGFEGEQSGAWLVGYRYLWLVLKSQLWLWRMLVQLGGSVHAANQASRRQPSRCASVQRRPIRGIFKFKDLLFFLTFV